MNFRGSRLHIFEINIYLSECEFRFVYAVLFESILRILYCRYLIFSIKETFLLLVECNDILSSS